MSGESASRRDKRWQARYARSQEQFEWAMAKIPDELHAQTAPPVSTIAVNGANYMLRLFVPGEPVRHDDLWAGFYFLFGMFMRGGPLPHRRNDRSWVVRLQRQRGPWRGFETVLTRSFQGYEDAAGFLDKVRRSLQSGQVPDESSL